MKNKYEINGEIVTIYVSKKDGTRYEVYIDLDIFKQIQHSSITIKQSRKHIYAIVRINGINYTLHRYVMPISSDEICIAIDNNYLNVCKSNLKAQVKFIKPLVEITGYKVKVFLFQKGVIHELFLDLHIWEEYKDYAMHVKPHGLKYSVSIVDANHKEHKLHRIITNAPENKQVDHIDSNPMNNELSNLRFCTGAENSQNRLLNKNNSSGCAGVSWCNTNNKWVVQPMLNGKRHKLGRFSSKDEAIKILKEFRLNNMPFSKEAMQHKIT
jgi:hypothetical protein